MERYDPKTDLEDNGKFVGMVKSEDGYWVPYADAQRALDAERERVRIATQLIIATIGSYGGPENLEEALGRMAAQLATLQAQLAAWQTGRMHVCLICGRDKPCMTDEEAIAEGGPGKPCTFDPTPRELFDENKRLKAQCSTDHFGEDFGDMKLGPLPPGHYWNVLREGCGPIQVNEQGQCVSACEEKHADPPHPTEERS